MASSYRVTALAATWSGWYTCAERVCNPIIPKKTSPAIFIPAISDKQMKMGVKGKL
jgi:hypothetical protein